MKKFKEKNANSFFYFLYVLLITTSWLFIYNIFAFNKEADPGFGHATSVDNEDICMGGIKNIKCQKKLFENQEFNNNSILFLGNSQTGAINHYKKGDNNFITYLNKKAKISKNSFKVKSIWLPNANLKEFEIINEGLKSCSLEPDILFLPLFLDDLRTNSIRNELDNYADYLCRELPIGKSIKNRLIIDNASQSNIEKLNYKLKNKTNIFYKLNSLNEKFRIHIYKLRNFVFNVKPTSIRRIKLSPYNENFNSLKNILHKRKNSKLKTFIYIPPLLNSDKKNGIPYDKDEYEKFKKDLKNICKEEVCKYLNLEKSVPNELWGLKNSTTFNKDKLEIDFFHFTDKGHDIFSQKLLDILISYLNQK